jgi:hypothetical protein
MKVFCFVLLLRAHHFKENRFDPWVCWCCLLLDIACDWLRRPSDKQCHRKTVTLPGIHSRSRCFTLAKSNAPRHHSGKSDSFRLSRLNINKQATRVVQWLSSGRGMVSTYCIVFFLRNSHNDSGEDPSLNAKIRFPIVREKLLFRYRLACAFSGHHI